MIATIAAIAEKKKIQRSHRSYGNRALMDWNVYLARVVQTLDSAIHRINHYQADSVIDFRNTYQLDSDLSGGYRYPTFEQPGPVVYVVQMEVFNGFTLKTVLSVLFNQMKNDPRNVVSEELNLKWQNQIESELRVLMPWRSAWRYRGHLRWRDRLW